MTAAQAVIVVGGSLVLSTATLAVMIRAMRSERRSMEWRRQEWVARGASPEEEPDFDFGSSM